jgi:hypothetical protein
MNGWKEWFDLHGEDEELESWDDVWQMVAQMSADEEEFNEGTDTPQPAKERELPHDDLPF